MDWLPTLCHLAGAEVPASIDGSSLLSLLDGGEPGRALAERTLFWVRREGGHKYGGRAYYAARQGHWKIVQNSPFEPLQLFDLSADPRETRPVDDPGRYRQIFKALQDHVNRSGGVVWQPPGIPENLD